MRALAAPPAESLVTPVVRPAPPPRRWDPRLFQIATLGGLLGYGMLWLGLDVDPWTAAIILATVLPARASGAQATFARLRCNDGLGVSVHTRS